MEYKGYKGNISYLEEDDMLVGRIHGIKDIISYKGASIKEVKKDFKVAVDDYIDTCKELGREPEKPYSGKLILRMKPELHAEVAREALFTTSSINELLNSIIRKHIVEKNSGSSPAKVTKTILEPEGESVHRKILGRNRKILLPGVKGLTKRGMKRRIINEPTHKPGSRGR